MAGRWQAEKPGPKKAGPRYAGQVNLFPKKIKAGPGAITGIPRPGRGAPLYFSGLRRYRKNEIRIDKIFHDLIIKAKASMFYLGIPGCQARRSRPAGKIKSLS
jgi:hypothetical protein